jgi:hypothetical protein
MHIIITLKNKLLVLLFFINLFSAVGFSQSYPFTLPSEIVATLNIDTTKSEATNNKLLGYNIFDFNTNQEKDFIRRFDPITIRFPHGVWANFYNWETDGYTTYDDTYDHETYDDILAIYAQINYRGGFPGLTTLNNEKKLTNNGAGYDMMWTYNLNYDDNAKTIARLKDSDAKGFDVRDIEFGNEHYWSNQRGTRTSTPQKYVTLAKSLSAALKAEKPSVRVSITLSCEANHASYNQTMVDNKTYFDAISLHRYLGEKPFSAVKTITNSEIITARLDLKKAVDFARSYAPGKPVWLTEWGYDGQLKCQAICALGMADCYLFLLENQDKYERANWFGVNSDLNGFVKVVDYKTFYPLEKTAYGSVYEIIRSVFENSTLLSTAIESPKLTTTAGSINAISARAVVKNGKKYVFAVNLTDKPAKLNLKFNSTIQNVNFVHQAYKFNNITEIKTSSIDAVPLEKINEGNGLITLPALSVNKIEYENKIVSGNFSIQDNFSTIFPNPSKNGLFELNKPHKWEAFSINGLKIAEGNNSCINLSKCTSGTYLIVLNGTNYHKVLIN